MTASLIMTLRHGEKPLGDGTVLGVNVAGHPNEHELSVRGWQRAGGLVPFFEHPFLQGIRTPDHLFAPGFSAQLDGVRPSRTLQPLADRLGLTVNTDFARGEEKSFAAQIAALDGVVLVALEHHELVHLARHLLGSSGDSPSSWPADRYDVVWTFTPDAGGWRFGQVPQQLLAGDIDDPIR